MDKLVIKVKLKGVALKSLFCITQLLLLLKLELNFIPLLLGVFLFSDYMGNYYTNEQAKRLGFELNDNIKATVIDLLLYFVSNILSYLLAGLIYILT
ncbi:hypothetical protein D3C81_11320 [compost metagenome]